jgi:hypothetical protein
MKGCAVALQRSPAERSRWPWMRSPVLFEYTPCAYYSGEDSFVFEAVNERGASAPATVSITVSGACTLEEESNSLE